MTNKSVWLIGETWDDRDNRPYTHEHLHYGYFLTEEDAQFWIDKNHVASWNNSKQDTYERWLATHERWLGGGEKERQIAKWEAAHHEWEVLKAAGIDKPEPKEPVFVTPHVESYEEFTKRIPKNYFPVELESAQ